MIRPFISQREFLNFIHYLVQKESEGPVLHFLPCRTDAAAGKKYNRFVHEKIKTIVIFNLTDFEFRLCSFLVLATGVVKSEEKSMMQ